MQKAFCTVFALAAIASAPAAGQQWPDRPVQLFIAQSLWMLPKFPTLDLPSARWAAAPGLQTQGRLSHRHFVRRFSAVEAVGPAPGETV